MGLFSRGEAPVGLILDGQPALRAYLGAVLVWDGTRSAFVSVLRMTGSWAAPAPVARADSSPAA
ncbi:hypothetical protein GQ85_10945, partial [Rhodococcus rhodochrous]